MPVIFRTSIIGSLVLGLVATFYLITKPSGEKRFPANTGESSKFGKLLEKSPRNQPRKGYGPFTLTLSKCADGSRCVLVNAFQNLRDAEVLFYDGDQIAAEAPLGELLTANTTEVKVPTKISERFTFELTAKTTEGTSVGLTRIFDGSPSNIKSQKVRALGASQPKLHF